MTSDIQYVTKFSVPIYWVNLDNIQSLLQTAELADSLTIDLIAGTVAIMWQEEGG
jgi:hypothetical protein